METNIAGHEGVGRVVERKYMDVKFGLKSSYRANHLYALVGKGVSSDVMGKLVGVKWVYSACGECETCKVRYVHCPHQNNSGRVSWPCCLIWTLKHY